MTVSPCSGGDYVFINPPKTEVPSWGEMTENAAHSLFITEIGRGMAVTLGHIFKEPATINYPFEKGPLSPRFRGEHALRRWEKKKVYEVRYDNGIYLYDQVRLWGGAVYRVQAV